MDILEEKKSRTSSASKAMEKTIERTKNNVTALTAIMFKSKKDPSSNNGGKSKDPPIFGGDLEEQCKNSRGEFRIPRVVQECIEVVEERGLLSQGIYRLSGNAASIQKLKSDYNNGMLLIMVAYSLIVLLMPRRSLCEPA